MLFSGYSFHNTLMEQLHHCANKLPILFEATSITFISRLPTNKAIQFLLIFPFEYLIVLVL
jgi:hypothetical protein